jgi:hypothetical protein
MRRTLAVTLVVLAFTLLTFAQNDLPIFRADAVSAFVWGEDNPSGAVSSSIRDPVTGNAIHKLSHPGIGVSSRGGFESVGMGAAGELLSFTTTIGTIRSLSSPCGRVVRVLMGIWLWEDSGPRNIAIAECAEHRVLSSEREGLPHSSTHRYQPALPGTRHPVGRQLGFVAERPADSAVVVGERSKDDGPVILVARKEPRVRDPKDTDTQSREN